MYLLTRKNRIIDYCSERYLYVGNIVVCESKSCNFEDVTIVDIGHQSIPVDIDIYSYDYIHGEFIRAEAILENGEGVESIVRARQHARALTENSVALGKDSIAGGKCFHITGWKYYESAGTSQFYLDSFEGLEEGMVCSIESDYYYDFFGNIIDINHDQDGQYIEVDAIPHKYTQNIYDTLDKGEALLWIPDHPELGTDNLVGYARASGERSIASTDHSDARGYKSIVSGKYGEASGLETKAGYAATAGGKYAEATGNHSYAHGYGSKARGNSSRATGAVAEALADGSFAHGQYVTARRNYETVFGRLNVPMDNALFSVGNGWKDPWTGGREDYSNAMVVYEDGSMDIEGGKRVATREYIEERSILEKRLTNVESSISSDYLIPYEEESVAKIINVNRKALPYASLVEIGGNSYYPDVLDSNGAVSQSNSLVHSGVSKIVSHGRNLFSCKADQGKLELSNSNITLSLNREGVVSIEKANLSAGGASRGLLQFWIHMEYLSHTVYPAGKYYFKVESIDQSLITSSDIDTSSIYMNFYDTSGDYIDNNTISQGKNKSFTIPKDFTIRTLSINLYTSKKLSISTTTPILRLQFTRSDNSSLPVLPYRDPIIYDIPSSITSLPDYGVGLSDDCYNYIDFERKKYIRKCASYRVLSSYYNEENPTVSKVFPLSVGYSPYKFSDNTIQYGWIMADEEDMYAGIKLQVKNFTNSTKKTFTIYYTLETPEEIDISEYLEHDAEYIEVESGGMLTFGDITVNKIPRSKIAYQLGK